MEKKDIEKIVKDNYKIMIPIIFMIVLFVAFISYYKATVNNNYRVEVEEDVYQYFYDKKYEYKANIVKNKKNVIMEVKPKNVKINLDSTPIYSNKDKTVIFPRNMSVIMPTIGCAEYLAKGYSYITLKKNIYVLTTDRYSNQLNHYFFYNGEDLYFFIENVTLNIGNESIKLSPYSYVISRYHDSVSYYDKKSDTYKTVKVSNEDVSIENDYYKIFPDIDTLDYQGNSVILSSDLTILNTIDKKGR